MAAKAFENPLVPNVRMKALYRALVESRVLSTPPKSRKNRVPHSSQSQRDEWVRGNEACYVATAIDLHPGDLISAPQSPALLDHIRAVGARSGARAASTSEIARTLNAAGLPSEATGFERLLTAAGMASALKTAAPGGAVVGYAATDALSSAEWKRLLQVALPGALPLMIVATPATSERSVDLSALVRKLGLKTLPVIPVDAGDPLALYRVAQETLVRARADGGFAVIECIPCGTDPIAMLAAQLLRKGIGTQRWIDSVEPGFRAALTQPKRTPRPRP